MSEMIYRVEIRDCALCPIEKLDVVNTASQDYKFYNTLEEAERTAENILTSRLQNLMAKADGLRERLQEICRHKEINNNGRCLRCDLRVPNSQNYTINSE